MQTHADRIFKACSVRDVHSVVAALADRLAGIPPLQYVKIYPERLAASNVLSSDGKKNPVVKLGAEGLVGVDLLVNPDTKIVQFFAVTSAVEAPGGQIVEAVLSVTPEDWKVVVLLDWSGGFWAKMAEDYPRLSWRERYPRLSWRERQHAPRPGRAAPGGGSRGAYCRQAEESRPVGISAQP